MPRGACREGQLHLHHGGDEGGDIGQIVENMSSAGCRSPGSSICRRLLHSAHKGGEADLVALDDPAFGQPEADPGLLRTA